MLTARTTIDVALQQAAEQALTSVVRQHARPQRRSGALVSMEPDGAVRALVGGLDYGESQFNRATHARRQPGSSFKLYVYAAALENGFTSNIDRARQRALLRQLVAEELRRRRRLAAAPCSIGRCLQVVAQHHCRRSVAEGSAARRSSR